MNAGKKFCERECTDNHQEQVWNGQPEGDEPCICRGMSGARDGRRREFVLAPDRPVWRSMNEAVIGFRALLIEPSGDDTVDFPLVPLRASGPPPLVAAAAACAPRRGVLFARYPLDQRSARRVRDRMAERRFRLRRTWLSGEVRDAASCRLRRGLPAIAFCRVDRPYSTMAAFGAVPFGPYKPVISGEHSFVSKTRA